MNVTSREAKKRVQSVLEQGISWPWQVYWLTANNKAGELDTMRRKTSDTLRRKTFYQD